MAARAWYRFLLGAIFAVTIGCVAAMLSLLVVRNPLYCRRVLQILFPAIPYVAFHFGGCTAVTFPGADAAIFSSAACLHEVFSVPVLSSKEVFSRFLKGQKLPRQRLLRPWMQSGSVSRSL